MPGLGADLVLNHVCSGMPCRQMLEDAPCCKPLPNRERRGEWLTLILRAFLIGDSVSWVGDLDRMGIEASASRL
jgi:hypothetical protein